MTYLKISILIPVYNEVTTLQEILKKVEGTVLTDNPLSVFSYLFICLLPLFIKP